jgi:GrpB-like predicted nucleotidyltransferase (UPF0157 family)
MLGLKHGENMLVEYDPAWESAFVAEKARLQEALGPLAKGIEHYGSTSVKGMRAKPILDILLGVYPLSDWGNCKLPLEGLGYDYAESAGVPGHYIFGRGRDSTERTHLVHVVEFLGESWRTNLRFRDALRTDPALRAAYIAAKEQAIAAAPRGRGAYNERKGAFIEKQKYRLLHRT